MSAERLPPFQAEYLNLPDKDLVLQFWAWWVVYQAERQGIAQDQITPEMVESIRRGTRAMDTRNISLAGLEKVLRVVASGDDWVESANLIRAMFKNDAIHLAALDEATTGRRRQKAIAKKPRHDALQTLIIDIMRKKPGIDQTELINRLKLLEHNGVIETVVEDEQTIEWSGKNGKAETAPLSGLKDRMSRARKFLNSR